MTGNKANKGHYLSSDSDRAQKFLKKVTFAQSKAYDELFTRICIVSFVMYQVQ